MISPTMPPSMYGFASSGARFCTKLPIPPSLTSDEAGIRIYTNRISMTNWNTSV